MNRSLTVSIAAGVVALSSSVAVLFSALAAMTVPNLYIDQPDVAHASVKEAATIGLIALIVACASTWVCVQRARTRL